MRHFCVFWDRNAKHCPACPVRMRRYRPTVAAAHLFAGGKADAAAVDVGVQAVEGLENRRTLRWVEPTAIVTHR